MGDVGSLALVARSGRSRHHQEELLLPFIGGVFVIEALSVILQVASYKPAQKRIFKMAPIHHHFELLGWSESKIIVRFWNCFAGVCAVRADHPETAINFTTERQRKIL